LPPLTTGKLGRGGARQDRRSNPGGIYRVGLARTELKVAALALINITES
jgi:hypothetical protein